METPKMKLIAKVEQPLESTLLVTFKDEGEVQGIPFGPVFIYHDPVQVNVPRPFGAPLHESIVDAGWLTLPEAQEMARTMGARFQQS